VHALEWEMNNQARRDPFGGHSSTPQVNRRGMT